MTATNMCSNFGGFRCRPPLTGFFPAGSQYEPCLASLTRFFQAGSQYEPCLASLIRFFPAGSQYDTSVLWHTITQCSIGSLQAVRN